MARYSRAAWIPLTLALLMLGGCGSGGPKMFWGVDEPSGKPAPIHHDLSVPPKNGTDLYQPPGDDEANAQPAGAGNGSSAVAAAMTNHGPSSSGRRWTIDISDQRSLNEAWPALLDAAVDLPLTNIDGASHVLTTDWINISDVSGRGSILGGPVLRRVRYALFAHADSTHSLIRVMAFAQARDSANWVNVKVLESDLKKMLDTLARHGWTTSTATPS